MSDIKTIRDQIFKSEFSTFYFAPNIKKHFDSIVELKSFLTSEAEFWEPYTGENINITRDAFSSSVKLLTRIETIVNESEIRSEFQKLNAKFHPNQILVSYSTEAQFITRLYKISPAQGSAAYKILIMNSLPREITNIDNFFASIASYEFLRKSNLADEEGFNSARLDSLSADYRKKIIEISNENEKLKKSFTILLDDTDKKLKQLTKDYEDNLLQKNSSFDSDKEKWYNEISNLEKTYGEKLILSKPAEYWEQLRMDYDKKGHRWKYWAIGSVGILIILLIILFFKFPEWLKGDFKIDHLKGALILTVIITVSSYLIHLFVKLSTSAFHLSRDAEERRQLTFLFLALLKDETKLSAKEREIVFQSLFSRADTGLLKSDGTPAIPGNLGELLKNIGNK